MDSEDGGLFIKNLAYFIRTHEKALADSLLLQRQPLQQFHSVNAPHTATAARPPTSASNLSSNAVSRSAASASASSWLPLFGRPQMKPARLFLTPNQLYYLLNRFDELGVNTGPMNIRLENLNAEPSSSNYVSFLAHTQPPKIKNYDTDSIHSVTSVRSLMSSMSSMLSNVSFANNSQRQQAKKEASARDDTRYLYSAFTKIPCLKISVDHRLKRIAGFEEFPFDTAVPITVFKNLTSFEIADIDFRSVYGWDVLAETVQSLTVKRGSIDDLSELLHDVVLDDMDQRRHRSSKIPASPMPLTGSSGLSKQLGWPGSNTPPMTMRPGSSDGAHQSTPSDKRSKKLSRSISPRNTLRTRTASMYGRSTIDRRASGSSQSSSRARTPLQSSSSLMLNISLPSTKWRFLKHLSVPDSGLTSISTESLLPLTDTLQSLDLSSNLFSDIPDALSSLVALRALNLSNCLVDSLRSLTRSPLPAITVLNLRSNKLNSLAGIEKLKSLHRLDVRENRLTDPTEAARLTAMPDFYEIYVKRNPYTTTHLNHRITVFNLFRATPGYTEDISIDGAGPDRSERRQLADRVPIPPQTAVVEPFTNTEMLADLRSAAAVSHAHPPPAGDTVTGAPATPNITTKASRRKGPRRRVVQVTETPDRQQDLDPPHTAYMTANESHSNTNHLAANDGHQSSPTPQQNEQRSQRRSDVSGKAESSRIDPRPPMSRGLSQSSEVFRQRIEALKNEHPDTWQKRLDSPRMRREPSISPMMKHQTSPGVFSPIKTASIASIHI